MTTTKTWGNVNRLTDIRTLNPQPSTPNAHTYSYNSANQGTRRTDADGSYRDYTYDSLGQVTGGAKKWPDGSLVPGQQFGYDFDGLTDTRATSALHFCA